MINIVVETKDSGAINRRGFIRLISSYTFLFFLIPSYYAFSESNEKGALPPSLASIKDVAEFFRPPYFFLYGDLKVAASAPEMAYNLPVFGVTHLYKNELEISRLEAAPTVISMVLIEPCLVRHNPLKLPFRKLLDVNM